MKNSIHHRSLAKLDPVGGGCEGDRAQKRWQWQCPSSMGEAYTDTEQVVVSEDQPGEAETL